MRILLSAYACEPNKGSEPGVGWSWANELANNHEVWVITRDNNEPTISAYLKQYPECKKDNLHFIYVGLSKKLTFWKKGRRGMRFFYALWQKKAVKVAMDWHKRIRFDLIQHVTFVSYTQPTYMYKLGIPMIWGPISGGENIPSGIQIEMSFKEKLLEFTRKVSQIIALDSPCIKKTMERSKLILVTTEETRDKIPSKYRDKTFIIPAIGLEKMPFERKKERNDGKIRIIMVGRLINWKAFDIGLKAFLKLVDNYSNIELDILGEGNQKEKLKELAGDKLNKKVFFLDAVEHDKIYDFYSDYDVFMNTTLRDSGCMSMMEAMSVGIPCIGISTGGPAVLLSSAQEYGINPTSYEQCINDLSVIIEGIIKDKKSSELLAKNEQDFVRENFVMSRKISIVENLLKSVTTEG